VVVSPRDRLNRSSLATCPEGLVELGCDAKLSRADKLVLQTVANAAKMTATKVEKVSTSWKATVLPLPEMASAAAAMKIGTNPELGLEGTEM
jgi:hypothetical protein